MRPNEHSIRLKKDLNHDLSMGNNQIGLQFKELFDLLKTHYYVGTKYDDTYNKLSEDGMSKIYVMQPDLHRELDMFVENEQNSTAYLVGYTGVGKTTLLRNYFRIFDRNPIITDDTIILYKSFLSDDIKNVDQFRRILASSINFLITEIIKKNKSSSSHIKSDEQFYNYILKNKGETLFDLRLTDELLQNLTDKRVINELLDNLYEKKPLAYSLLRLKFLLISLNKYKKIVFIYDDIERHDKEIQLEFIDSVVDTINNCFAAIETNIKIKTLVSLRNYLYRTNNARRLSALRKDDPYDNHEIKAPYILKKYIPSLTNIIKRRYDMLKEIVPPSNIKRYDDYKQDLDIVFNRLYNNYDNIILNLTQKNIYTSLRLFSKMLTNKRYIGKYETENKGAFEFDSSNYLFKSDDVMYAFAYGEDDIYYSDNSIFANILYNHEEQCENSDLISLYIIRYYYNNQYNNFYGDRTVPVKIILDNFDNIFSRYTDCINDKYKCFSEKAFNIIKPLYKSGVLLKSVHDIEFDEDFWDDNSRTCDKDSLLYLSPRGTQLYEMLNKNTLYFNIIRDDIDTELEFNDTLSRDLSEIQKLQYYLNYIKVLFQKEKAYISAANRSLKTYIKAFGNELIISILLEGFVETITTYFTDKNRDINKEALSDILNQFIDFYRDINEYIDFIYREYRVIFKINEKIVSYYNRHKVTIQV